MISLNFYAMAAAGTRQLDSPGSNNLYFIGVAGVVAISLVSSGGNNGHYQKIS